METFLHRQSAVEDRVRIVDLTASRTGEIAAEQRFQHQNQRIALAPEQLLLEEVSPNSHFLEERYFHWSCSVKNRRGALAHPLTSYRIRCSPFWLAGRGNPTAASRIN